MVNSPSFENPETLRVPEQLLRCLPITGCTIGRDGAIRAATPDAAALFGRTGLAGCRADRLVPGADAVLPGLFDRMARGAALPDHHASLGARHFHLAFHPVDADTLGVVATDITRRIEAERQMRAARRRLIATARTDWLTGAYNRRGLDALLHRELRRARRSAKPLAVIAIDIDWFKGYNDIHGHGQGDVCLRAVAGALGSALRRGGDALARYGGEEFVLILPDTDAAGAASVARHCLDAVHDLALPHPGSPRGRISISIGVEIRAPAASPLGIAEAAASLLQRADRALYRAKHRGRDRVEFAWAS